MKEVIIVGSYCDTQIKLKALEDLLDAADEAGLPVIAFGRWPIPERLQKKCTYWIYDKSNPILEERLLDHWLKINGEQLSNYFFDFGYAALEQIVKTLGFAKNLHYDIAYWLNYDVDMSAFQNFREKTRSTILDESIEAACTQFKPISTEPLRGINTTSIAFKVLPAYEKLRGVLSKSFYRKCVGDSSSYLAEDFMEDCFKAAEVDYRILPTEFFPPAILTSTGVRKHGHVPEELTKIHTYLTSFFIGLDHETGKAVCYIWNMKKPIQKIIVDFGFEQPIDLRVNGNQVAKFTLDRLPKTCKILEVDSDSINEELDAEYSDRYWDMNKIRTLH